jgi:two-component system, chemotaxis family, response regulator Rcp1
MPEPIEILAEEDILRTYRDHANCCVTKSMGFDRFIDTIRSIEHFWLTIVRLPNGAHT